MVRGVDAVLEERTGQVRETDALEREFQRLAAERLAISWDRGSWIRGAMYALAWVINRRGAAVPPLEAAKAFVPETGGVE